MSWRTLREAGLLMECNHQAKIDRWLPSEQFGLAPGLVRVNRQCALCGAVWDKEQKKWGGASLDHLINWEAIT